MKCQILCRGSYREGTDYVNRAIELARTLHPKFDLEVVAIVPRTLEGSMRNEDFPVRIVRSERNALSYIDIFGPDVLLLDVAKLEAEFLSQLKAQVPKVMALAPDFKQGAQVDWKVDYATPEGAHHVVIPEGTHRILTSRFEVQVEEEMPNVYVALDGARVNDMALYTIKMMLANMPVHPVYVLTGLDDSQRFAAFRRQAERDEQITVLDQAQPESRSALIASAFGIFTGGLPSMQAVYAGLPGIHLFDRARTQRAYAPILAPAKAEMGLFIELVPHKIRTILQHWLADRSKLMEQHMAARRMNLSNGTALLASRIEREVVPTVAATTSYRKAA